MEMRILGILYMDFIQRNSTIRLVVGNKYIFTATKRIPLFDCPDDPEVEEADHILNRYGLWNE